MRISPKHLSLLLLFIGLLFVSVIPISGASSDTHRLSTAHDILAQYGLPKGLLPDTVTSYSLSPDGSFRIELRKPCYVQFDDLVYYERKIAGKLTYGLISDLSGIQAKKVFLWVPVTGIEMDLAHNEIEFHVGFLSEKLPAGQFQDIPSCKSKGCGGAVPGEASVAEVRSRRENLNTVLKRANSDIREQSRKKRRLCARISRLRKIKNSKGSREEKKRRNKEKIQGGKKERKKRRKNICC